MYTTPAKVTVPAKTLIQAFETRQLKSLSSLEEEVEESQKPLHPEICEEELAEPGTAKKLLKAFEFKRNQSITSPPPTSAEILLNSRRLSVSRFSSFEEKAEIEKKRLSSSIRNSSGLGLQGNAADIIIGQNETLNRETSGLNGEITVKKETAELVNGTVSHHDVQSSSSGSITITTTTVTVESANGINAHNLVEEKALEKLDQRGEEKIEEKITEKVEHVQEVIEEKLEEKLQEKTGEKVSVTEEIKTISEPERVVVEVVKETVEVSSVKQVEPKADGASSGVAEDSVLASTKLSSAQRSEEKLEGKTALTIEVQTEEKLEEKVEEIVEDKVVKTLKERTIKELEEELRRRLDEQRLEDIRQGTVEEAGEKVEERISEEAVHEEKVTSTTVEVLVTEVVGDGVGEVATASEVLKIETVPSRRILLVAAIKPENDVDKALRAATVRILEDSGHSIGIKDVFDNITPDYEEERKKLLEADLLIFHYRPILNSPPALLKSWLEGALIESDGTPVDKVALQGRRAVLLVSCADVASDECTSEKLPFISAIQDSVLRAYDMDVQQPFIVFQAGQGMTEEIRAGKIEDWTKRLSAIITL